MSFNLWESGENFGNRRSTPRRAALLAGVAALSALPLDGASAGDCAPGVVTGNLTCRNERPINASTPGVATFGATGTLDVTNTATGQFGAGNNASAIYAGGDLTLVNAGRILSLAGASNVTVMTNGGQAGTTTITNSGFIGDAAESGGGARNVIRSLNPASTFTLNNTATGIIKSTISGAEAVSLSGTSIRITNAGSIIATAGHSALTVANALSTRVDNSGLLNEAGTATFYGLVATTPGALSLTNSGGIFGATSALWLTSGVSATIDTSGMIASNKAPIYFRGTATYNPGIALDAGSSLDLSNSGTITAPGAGIKVNAGARAARISNSGTISATALSAPAQVKVSGVYLDSTTDGTSIDNSGRISGTVYGVYLNSGSMTLTNSGTISGGTSAVFLKTGGNTLNIYSDAVFSNGIDYNNTTGNKTNFYSGSYTLGVSNYKLDSNSIALFGPNTALITSGLNGAGTGQLVIIDTSAQGAATTAGSVLARQASSVIGDILLEDVGVADIIPRGPGAATAQPSAMSAYQDERGFSGKTGRLSAAFAEVLDTSADASATDLILQGSGQTVDKFGNLVWTRAFGGAEFQDASGSASGQRSYSAGAMVGYDWRGDNGRLGGFIGLGRTRTSQPLSADQLTSDTAFGGIYGRYSFGNVTLDGTLSGGTLDLLSRRAVNNGAETARGDFSGTFIAPEAAISYNADLGDGLILTPRARLRYVASSFDAYTETGSSQNVSYGAVTSDLLEESAELRLTRTIRGDDGQMSSVYVQAAAITAQNLGPADFAASVLGTPFTVSNGDARSRAGASLGLGFTSAITPQFDLYGSVDGAAFTDRSASISVRGGFKVAF